MARARTLHERVRTIRTRKVLERQIRILARRSKKVYGDGQPLFSNTHPTMHLATYSDYRWRPEPIIVPQDYFQKFYLGLEPAAV